MTANDLLNPNAAFCGLKQRLLGPPAVEALEQLDRCLQPYPHGRDRHELTAVAPLPTRGGRN